LAFYQSPRDNANAMRARLKEYGFLLLAGCFGAAFAVMNDLITSWISPEYFVVGKGLEAGDGFLARVVWLAVKAGFAAGAGGGAIALYTNNPKPGSPSLPFMSLLVQVWKPIVCAALTGIGLGAAAHFASLPSPLSGLSIVMAVDDARWFTVVWYVHLGLYVGLAIGVMLVVVAIRRKRRAIATDERCSINDGQR
jgi:hypothetical protein